MSGLACCWPPSVDGGGGSLEIAVTPVVGGVVGEVLKVGPGGVLDQAPIPVAPLAIGSPVAGGTANDVLFVDAAGKLAQAAGFTFDAATQNFSIPARWLVRADQETIDWRGSTGAVHYITNVHTEANGFGDPEPCQVIEIGWNFDGVNNAFGGWDFTSRSYLRTGAGANDKVQTWALQHVSKFPVAPAIRDVISIVGNQETGNVALKFSASDLQWGDPFGFNPLGVLANDGITLFHGGLHCITYGDRALQQNNHDNNNAERLVMLATSLFDGLTFNTMQLGAGESIVQVEVYPPLLLGTASVLDTTRCTAPQLKMTKTDIVPVGALARFKVQDETGAVFYLTGQAA